MNKAIKYVALPIIPQVRGLADSLKGGRDRETNFGGGGVKLDLSKIGYPC